MVPKGLATIAEVRSNWSEDRPDYSQIFSFPDATKKPTEDIEEDTQPSPTKPQTASYLIVVSEPSWCDPCRKLEPKLLSLQKAGYDITIENRLEYRKRKDKERIPGFPVLFFYSENDKLMKTKVGNVSEKFIKELFDGN